MDVASEIVEIAEQQCIEQGIRVTKKRVRVFSLLQASKKAVSAYELAESYEQNFGEQVPVMTVYRVLDFLQNENLVHKLETANKFIVCEHIGCNHKHSASQFLICKECLKVKELGVSKEKFEELKQTIEDAGFYIDTHQLEMNCICNGCYEKE